VRLSNPRVRLSNPKVRLSNLTENVYYIVLLAKAVIVGLK